PGVRQVGEGPGGQVVHHIDVVSLGEQPVDQGGANETSPAGDEGFHGASAGTRPASTWVPGGTTAASPTTERWVTTAPAPMRAPRPTIEHRTWAPAAMTASSKHTELATEAPGPTVTPSPST